MTTVSGITNAEYHSDHTSLSASGAKLILKSPAKFRWQQQYPVFKDVFDFGTVAHKLVLGEGDEITIVDAPDWRTKSAKEQRDAARSQGHTPILLADYHAAAQMAAATLSHPIAAQLLSSGVAEQSGKWVDEATGVTCRFRPDWITQLDGPVCVDFKTALNAHPDEFHRPVANFGYHQQAAWYIDGLNATGTPNARFLFIVTEKTRPHLTSVLELDADAIDEGRRLNRQAIDLFAECTATDTWPGYGDEIVSISLPPWAFTEQEIEV